MYLLLSLVLLAATSLSMNIRDPKTLPYMEYLSPEEYDYDIAMAMGQNDISRTLPKRKPYDSPIYYIRLPPQPYMFVPGLGYISRPAPPPPQMHNQMSPFLTLPLDFVANGKPSTIYQWSAGGHGSQKPPKPQRPDSNVHNLEGQFTFNGKPENVFVLRDSYNALYGDALQNFYP